MLSENSLKVQIRLFLNIYNIYNIQNCQTRRGNHVRSRPSSTELHHRQSPPYQIKLPNCWTPRAILKLLDIECTYMYSIGCFMSFWANFYCLVCAYESLLRECSPPQTCHVSCVMCQVSRVTCHVSHVTCHMSHILFFFFGQSGEAYRWRVCFQRGLPRLVEQLLAKPMKWFCL